MKGVWQIRYDGAPDADGKIKKVAETIRGSKREAERVLRERVGTVETGAYIEKSDTKVSEFMERWLSTYVATNTSVRTQQGYKYYEMPTSALFSALSRYSGSLGATYSAFTRPCKVKV